MNITAIDIHKLNVSFEYPTKTPIGTLESAQNVLVKITTDSGLYGWGEASPFAPITGDSQQSNFITAGQLAELIKGKNALDTEGLMHAINRFTVAEPSIRSAFDMALYDLRAKAAGLPLYALLGGGRRELRTDLTIGMQNSVEETVACAERILAKGFNAIKMKVGRPDLADVAHVAAVRKLAGADVAIKVDSNQGWSYQDAVQNILAMAPLKLQYSEQPIAAWDYDNLRRLRDKVSLPICADESLFDDRDALKLVSSGAADYLNIKLGKSGGIHTALNINAIAQAAGCRCMIGCFAESRLALSAAAHLAMARPNIHFLDLDSAFNFNEDPVLGGMTYDEEIGGLLHLPETPGHGADIDENFLAGAEHQRIA